MKSKRFDSPKTKSKKEIELGSRLLPKFNEDGLIPCITTDASSREVLMFAWMNEEALSLTLKTGKATYYSRSRKKLWVKGESSGREQKVVQLLVDCDQDVIQLRVQVQGEGTCHNGYRSCFYRAVKNGSNDELEYVIEDRAFDPDEVYGA
ncbi:phosphoribosyl-AMP cyclohydrolase [Rhodohalobacter sp. SW132]|uniref:phosphoribosyl-AMP cyclohydrolase n=1 Tax=Rhodohalobacter sp. SW132 TaxID=2293433 RepID=UPI000E28A18D|nr:phosphoribosyl-AMP cyclohydrolase [Rhodohalobacter sp. SW132]REL37619.1 phosphoribosyl-AMP cyclohydrolase [Rhodohalobacter sp. SW132]